MEEKKKRIDELVEIINKASYEYYLNDSPSITDQEYDDYYSELLRLEENYMSKYYIPKWSNVL